MSQVGGQGDTWEMKPSVRSKEQSLLFDGGRTVNVTFPKVREEYCSLEKSDFPRRAVLVLIGTSIQE